MIKIGCHWLLDFMSKTRREVELSQSRPKLSVETKIKNESCKSKQLLQFYQQQSLRHAMPGICVAQTVADGVPKAAEDEQQQQKEEQKEDKVEANEDAAAPPATSEVAEDASATA